MIKALNSKEIIDLVYKTPQYYKLSKQEGINRIGFDPTQYPIDYIQDFYANKVFSEPTKEEMEIITPSLNEADNLSLKILSKLGIDKKLDWKIVKINSGFDWDYPQTRADVVFIPEYFFQTPNVKTLVHEKMHLYQREYPKLFENLYNRWGFKKIKLNDSEKEQINSRGLYSKTINNPDTTDGGTWVFRKNKDEYLLPVYAIKSNGKPTTLGFIMDANNRNNSMYFVGDISDFSNFFGANQIDHPNEIFACRETKNISY